MYLQGVSLFLGYSCVFIGIFHILVSRVKKSIFLSGFFFSWGLNIITLNWHYNKFILNFPFLIFTSALLPYLYVPFWFLFVKTLIETEFQFKKSNYLHFLPFVLCLIFLVPFFMISPGEKINIAANLGPAEPPDMLLGKEVVFTALLYCAFYLSWQIYIVYKKINWGAIKEKIKNKSYSKDFFLFFLFMVIIHFIAFDLTIVAIYYEKKHILLINSVTLTLYFIFMYVLYYLFPFMHQLGAFMPPSSSFSMNRYIKTKLKNVDVVALEKKLKRLMKIEKIYKTEKITLKSLAKRLNLTTHQLSEYLNAFLSLSFADYLHNIQIKEAKRILAKDMKTPVSRVGFEVGFHSESSFYSVFQKDTGLSPGDFRKQHEQKNLK
ncbi:MAG: helix-turn-helix domain-containing protein [Spirochaetia bacterium]|nr:helix-turn-helix domain-containing protein [Spirochaetia bacterium]